VSFLVYLIAIFRRDGYSAAKQYSPRLYASCSKTNNCRSLEALTQSVAQC